VTRALEACRNIADLRALARRRMPAPIFHYVDGGAEDEVTLRRNTQAFEDYELEPEYAVDVSAIDTSTTILGQQLDWPVVAAPTGLLGLLHRDGEIGVARALARSGSVFTQSCMSNVTIEDVGAVPGAKMLQAYTFRDRGLTREFIARGREAGFVALCLTFDVPVPGMRERDLLYGLTVPPRLSIGSLLDFALHPRWSLRYLSGPPLRIANVAHRIAEGTSDLSSIIQFVTNQYDPSATWDDAAEMIGYWDGPVAIKGVMTPGDAKRAAAAGASAIVVSNHGGRQLDGAAATIDRLAPVVDAVGGDLEVILDGGIRRGSHVIKALALGARACMAGRAFLYGLGAGGEAGVDRACTILHQQIRRSMALSGVVRTADITRERVSWRRPARPV